MTALSPSQLDLLQELINIGVGHAASTLNQMSGQHVHLHAPQVAVKSIEEMLAATDIDVTRQVMAIKLTFGGTFSGMASLMFPPESANKLIAVILGEEPVAEDMDMMRVGVLQEVGNIVLNGVMGSIGNLLTEHIDYLPPDYYETNIGDLLLSDRKDDDMLLLARTNFYLENRLIQGDVLIMFRMNTFDNLLDALNRMMAAQGMTSDAAPSETGR